MHRLRWHYQNSTNQDVFAFHEAMADLMALFQHFLYRDIVADAIKNEKGNVSIENLMFELASEFGYSLGRGVALRSALNEDPNPKAFRQAEEPHQRGNYFVAAVFDAYREYFSATTKDLIRIATNGTGELPSGQLTPELTARLTSQALNAADRFLAMVVGAFNYLPPCDVTFGDVVRAIVTADWSLNPEDASGVRRTMVEALRRRGIVPDGVSSLSEEALLWPEPESLTRLFEARDDWDNFPVIAFELIRRLERRRIKVRSEGYDETQAQHDQGPQGLGVQECIPDRSGS